MHMKWLAILLLASTIVACRTKKEITHESLSLNHIEALDLWDYDTIFPTVAVATTAGDSVAAIIRHRHLTTTKKQQFNDSLNKRRETQTSAQFFPNHEQKRYHAKFVLYAFIGILVCVLVMLCRSRVFRKQ